MGENFTALETISPVYGLVFGAAVGLLGDALNRKIIQKAYAREPERRGIEGQAQDGKFKNPLLNRVAFLSLPVSYAIAGTVVYGGALALSAAGATSAAITVPGAITLTATSLVAKVAIQAIQRRLG